ncbi:hypothetical protein L207DRAFT_590415 [Hyaloscypha variabilis F]|uniref:Uncharacterized protein n=1 Tax=Hyaloscypha variabilis (strain UAMH 11265 / GT02V1 / F) TaxID=1149755 RepID=A0A2J6R2I0_HYAVF|nr:hypothetical protein L207DRAFT_590415 [Hyaloscypha variabilis F]
MTDWNSFNKLPDGHLQSKFESSMEETGKILAIYDFELLRYRDDAGDVSWHFSFHDSLVDDDGCPFLGWYIRVDGLASSRGWAKRRGSRARVGYEETHALLSREEKVQLHAEDTDSEYKSEEEDEEENEKEKREPIESEEEISDGEDEREDREVCGSNAPWF